MGLDEAATRSECKVGDDFHELGARHFWSHQSWFACFIHAMYRKYVLGKVDSNGYPARWSGNTRNWQHIGAVTLNPERDSVISEHATENYIQQLVV